MKVLFAGTPEIAIPCLKALSARFELVGVLTAPDAPSGRGRSLEPSPVKSIASELGLRVFTPQRLDGTIREEIASLGADILVCFAYGKIFGPKFLALFPFGGINIHPSLLPELRGPSPIASAILQGKSRTGITVQTLALEMDAGDIIIQEGLDLTGSETTGSLSSWAAERGAVLACEAVRGLAEGTVTPRPQEGQVSFCRLLVKDDGMIDWTQDALAIERKIRAYDPWPRAFSTWNGQTLFILEASTADSPLGMAGSAKVPGEVLSIDKKQGILVQTGAGLCAIKRLQIQGKKPMDALSFINGARGFLGATLGGS